MQNFLYFYQAELVRVVDGDTFIANIDLGFNSWQRDRRIRIKGINAPEIKDKKNKESTKIAGFEAKAMLERTLSGNPLIIHSTGFDDFGRILAHVSVDLPVSGWTNVGDLMIAEGFAAVF